MQKLERLLNLLTVLLDTSVPLTAEDLRGRIGAYSTNDDSFRRTFERDKDDLRKMGVDIRVAPDPTTEPPVDGYIVDQDQYAGRDPGLDADELAALHLAAALVRVERMGDAALDSTTFWKLGGSHDNNPDTETPAVQVATGADTDVAGLLQEAIADRRTARFSYADVDRILEPGRLSFARGHWYVSGFDRTREADRVFRLDRIAGSLELGSPDSFEARPARGPQVTRTWELGDEEPIETEVQIESEMIAWARIQLEDHEIAEQSDGSVIATVSVRNTAMFRDWVLRFYDNAVVLSPPEMRSMMADWLRKVAS